MTDTPVRRLNAGTNILQPRLSRRAEPTPYPTGSLPHGGPHGGSPSMSTFTRAVSHPRFVGLPMRDVGAPAGTESLSPAA